MPEETAPALPRRSRRAARPSGDERQRAIVATAERLLAERAFDAIAVDDLARGAGISRPTFYFYFASKEAVLLELLDVLTVEARERLDAVPREVSEPRVEWWRTSIAVFVDLFAAHRAVIAAATEVRTDNGEVRATWSAALTRWVERTAAVIEAERARGAAPDGLPARDIAVALNSLNDRMLTATFGGGEPAVPADRVLDVLTALWTAAIYGSPAA